MKSLIIFGVIIAGMTLQTSTDRPVNQDDTPIYKNPQASLDERVEDLLSRMTIEEKIGQMSQLDFSTINKDDAPIITLDEEKARKMILNHHVGSFMNGEAVPPQQWYDFVSRLARIAVEESRLGIPIIYGIDHVHGASYMSETTIFPQPINIAATFDSKHSHNMGWVTAVESADVGHRWNFAPTLDLGVNQIWSRLYESFGEDPHLAAEMGRAFVIAYQENDDIYPYKLAANAKHFIGYSDPVSGWDKTQVQLGMQQLYELHLPPFQAAIEAGVRTVMANSSELNGTPAHASYELLTELLRNQLGFEGVVVTDWDEIGKLADFHRTAHDYKEGTYHSIMAGVDMSMTPLSLNFNEAMMELYEEGKITEERIDMSVRRILRLKFEIGLFEHPFPRNDRFDRIGSEENRLKALEAARESLVLLKNDNNVFPLQNPAHIILAGPTADNKRNLSGGWTLAWQGGAEERYPEDMHTIYTALQQEFPDARIDLMENIPSISDELVTNLNQADVIIYAGGEEPYAEFLGNIVDANLPQEQKDDIRTLAASDTPLAVVMVQGRPRLITDIHGHMDVLIHAGLPGFEGAEAIANIISGKVNPSGKLPFSYPRYTGHYLNYNYKPSDLYFYHPENQDHINSPNHTTMLYHFGDGLSYTTFKYSDLKIDLDTIRKGERITATATVKNTGEVAGKEAVLWYLTNVVGRVSRPVRELKHFEKVHLEPGESKTVTFEITPEAVLWYPDARGNRIFEEGEFLVRMADMFESFRYLE